MSRPRLLADHDLDGRIIEGVLREEPSAVFVTARSRGWQTLPDADLLARAADEGLVVVSHDVNTMTAAAYARLDSNLPMAGLMIARQRRPIGRTVEDVVLVWSVMDAEELDGTVHHLPL